MRFSLRLLLTGNIVLILIFLLSLFLRAYDLGIYPVGFHGDEIELGYNAYSILKTGHDRNGNYFPIAIDQWGDFRPAGYHYLTIPGILLFGLNEFAVRFPGAFFGALSVLVIYFLTKSLFNNHKQALISAAILATNPWHINASRATSESIIALFFVIAGIYLFVTALKNHKNITGFVPAYLCLLISFLFYHASRVFVPVFILCLILFMVVYMNKVNRKIKISLAVLSFLLICFLAVIMIFSGGINRPANVSIFNNPGIQLILDRQIREDEELGADVTRVSHNKFVSYSNTFLDNYFQHFTFKYLFLSGGFPARYFIPYSGNFLLLLFPFLVIGFCFLVSDLIKTKNVLYFIPVLWLLAGPFPAAPSYEDIPNIQRSIMMVPALVLIMSYGIIVFFNLVKPRLTESFILICISLVMVYNFYLFIHNYLYHAHKFESWHRAPGEKELVLTIDRLSKKYDKIITTTANENNMVYYLFYLQIDPGKLDKYGVYHDDKGWHFKNIVFTPVNCPLKQGDVFTKNSVYINKGDCIDFGSAELLSTIRRPDNSIAFYILRPF